MTMTAPAPETSAGPTPAPPGGSAAPIAPLRVVTLVLGGLLAVLALAAATIGGLIALGITPLSSRQFTIPGSATSLVVRSERLNLHVGDPSPSTGGPAVAQLSGTSSAALGPVPGIRIEMQGTTAVITPEEGSEHLPLSPYSLTIDLRGRAFDTIDVASDRGYVGIHAGARELRAVSRGGSIDLAVPETESVERITAIGAGNTNVVVPETGGPYRVLTPGWLDAQFVDQWWRDRYGVERAPVAGASDWVGADRLGDELVPRPGLRAEDGPGVFVPTADDARVTIDLRSAGGYFLQVSTFEALDR